MDVYIEGYISKKAIKSMLEDYHEMNKKGTDYSQPRGGSRISNDGWSGKKINKLMIKHALEKIPDKVTKYCAYARWVHLIPRAQILKGLESTGNKISAVTYYNRCNAAIDFIYQEINKDLAVKALVETVLENEGEQVNEI